MSDAKSGPPAPREFQRAVSTKLATPVVEYASYTPYPTGEREGASFGTLGEKLLRRWRLIAAVFLALAGLGVGVTLAQTPRYSATALLMINPTPDQIVPDKQSSNGRSDAAIVASGIEVL
jgi:uncharacterized protein involved in exopolysaccharide biosynthesis